VAVAVDLCGFALEPAMVAIGRPGAILAVRAGVGVVYLGLMFVLLKTLGAIGGALAAVVSSLLMLGFLLSLAWKLRGAGGPVGGTEAGGDHAGADCRMHRDDDRPR
jgi:hypothetical protein